MGRTLFIGGVHGAGKTHFCRLMASEHGLRHENAGNLIQQETDALSRDKAVEDVAHNQAALLRALDRLPVSDTPILLDGHFCVLQSDGELIPIPVRVFRHIAPVAAIVATESPDKIQSRIEARDSGRLPACSIQELQEQEVAHARLVCRTLGCPLLVAGLKDQLQEATAFLMRHS